MNVSLPTYAILNQIHAQDDRLSKLWSRLTNFLRPARQARKVCIVCGAKWNVRIGAAGKRVVRHSTGDGPAHKHGNIFPMDAQQYCHPYIAFGASPLTGGGPSPLTGGCSQRAYSVG
jgi:hypothetical protein